MEIKKTKVTKKQKTKERYIKVIFDDHGVRIDKDNVDSMSFVEAILALIIGLQNLCDDQPCGEALEAIHTQRMAYGVVHKLLHGDLKPCKTCKAPKAKKATKKK